ncbi:MAG TPA: hypothetical protein VE993_13285 [Stellaceae bacterium]|nr:hypothetical protein [Stellaceae bacterium]
MPKTHPHTGASYRILPRDDGAFAVEVTIPDSNPTTVSSFATKADAEAWIDQHRRRIESQAVSGRWFRKHDARPRGNPEA